MRIGFAGAGLMGRPPAQRLVAAGHQLFVRGRRYDTVEPLPALGAAGKASPAGVADVGEAPVGGQGALQRVVQT